MKKKILLLIIPFFAVGAGVFGFMAVRQTQSSMPPEYYLSRSETLSSVTQVLGTRKCERLSKATKDSASYKYYPSGNVQEDIQEYTSYLTTTRNFINISQLQDENDSASQEDKTYCFAGPSEKDPDSYLEIRIQPDSESYTITINKNDTPWNSYITTLWKEEEDYEASESETESIPTIQRAEETVRSMSAKELGLKEPLNQYHFIADPGMTFANENNYYEVAVYRTNSENTFDYVCSFLLDPATCKVVYRYDDASGNISKLS